jgi:hypothetical protein
MKTIEPTANEAQWPRKAVKSLDLRKSDLVVRITDWTKDRDEPAYDVEVYVGGVYDFNLSKVFSTKNAGRTKAEARRLAVEFASKQIAELL